MVYVLIFTCAAQICMSNAAMRKHDDDRFGRLEECQAIGASLKLTNGSNFECVDATHVFRYSAAEIR